jgi:hypothetical protein
MGRRSQYCPDWPYCPCLNNLREWDARLDDPRYPIDPELAVLSSWVSLNCLIMNSPDLSARQWALKQINNRVFDGERARASRAAAREGLLSMKLTKQKPGWDGKSRFEKLAGVAYPGRLSAEQLAEMAKLSANERKRAPFGPKLLPDHSRGARSVHWAGLLNRQRGSAETFNR